MTLLLMRLKLLGNVPIETNNEWDVWLNLCSLENVSANMNILLNSLTHPDHYSEMSTFLPPILFQKFEA